MTDDDQQPGRGAKARAKLHDAADRVRQRTGRAADQAREQARRAAAQTGDLVDGNPLALVAGGIAVGAVIGALLPATEQERKLIGGAGQALKDRAREAASAAKSAGLERLDTVGLSGGALRDQVGDVVKKASSAFMAAGSAASDAARSGRRTAGSAEAAGSTASD